MSQDQGDCGFEDSNKDNDVNSDVEGADKKIYLKRGESLKQSRLKAGDLVSIQNPENMNVFVFFILLLSFLILLFFFFILLLPFFKLLFIVNDNVIAREYQFNDHHDHGCYSQGGKRLEVPKRVSCDGANLVVAQVSETRLLDHQTNN